MLPGIFEYDIIVSYNSAKTAFKEFLLVVKVQLVIGILAIITSLLLGKNLITAFSAFLGLCLSVLPALVYIKIAYSKKILSGEIILAMHKKAELYKFMTTISGFILVFICFKQVHVLALFITYIATLSSYWLSLFWLAKSKD